MACFVVPATEAIVTTAISHVLKHKNKSVNISAEGNVEQAVMLPFSKKLGWLNKMLWGGSALLAFEHAWHGEISPIFPFLTAVRDGETAGMLAEMSTTGVMMAVIVTAVWIGMLTVSSVIEKKAVLDDEKIEEAQ